MSALPESRHPANEVELTSLDLRYEGCRLKQAAGEERLLASIAERGIEEALEGVEVDERRVLLNGFKRYRCARKLRLGTVPYASLGRDEAAAMVMLLRVSNDRALSILEQAAFLDELKGVKGLSVAEIAARLSRSKAWVTMRLGLLGAMSGPVRARLFSGAFPVYAYMYSLRPFMRMNAAEVERFVLAVSGQNLSVREIEVLARAFFQGSAALREEIARGEIAPALARLEEAAAPAQGCSEMETRMLRDLEIVNRAMWRVRARGGEKLASGAFRAQARLLAEAILGRAAGFVAAVKLLYDHTGPA